MALEETLACDPFRAADQRQRTIGDELGHARPDLRKIFCKPLLGDSRIRPVDPIRMGQPDRGQSFRRRHLLAGFADDILGRPILAETAKGGMADRTFGRPCLEFDFSHQLRPGENHASARFGRKLLAERALFLLQFLETLEQISGDLAGEAGADTTGMDQGVALVDAKHERADHLVGHRRGNIAGNDEFLPFRAFRLDPAPASPRAIGAAGLLRGDALQADPAGMAEHYFAVLDEMLAIAEGIVAVLKQRAEDRKSTRLNSSHVAISYAV